MAKRVLIFSGGLILGVLLALLVGWVLVPIPRYDGGPETMRQDYQYEYIRLVAVSYQVNGDLNLAQTRLRHLDPESPTGPLVTLVERWIDDDRSAALITPLAQLADDLDAATPAMAPYLDRGAG